MKVFVPTRTGRVFVLRVKAAPTPGFTHPSCVMVSGSAWPFVVIFRGHQPRLSVHVVEVLAPGVHQEQPKSRPGVEGPANKPTGGP